MGHYEKLGEGIGEKGAVGQWILSYSHTGGISAGVLLHRRVDIINNNVLYILKQQHLILNSDRPGLESLHATYLYDPRKIT
jgi:hypothetical protein